MVAAVNSDRAVRLAHQDRCKVQVEGAVELDEAHGYEKDGGQVVRQQLPPEIDWGHSRGQSGIYKVDVR